MARPTFSAARVFAAALLALFLAATAAPTTPALAHSDVSVGFFYDSLEPEGRWVDHWRYGRVWYPERVADDWRPYTRGRWVLTEDYGWYWESYETFGWATYHYGRWASDEDYGWFWVPGDQWGPSWVDWRHGDGFVGWAPLPPEVSWHGSGFDYGGLDIISVRYRPIWCFVEERHFVGGGDVYRHVVAPSRNVTIINRTTNITNYTVVNNTIVNNSVNVTRISAATRTQITPVSVTQAAAPAAPVSGGRHAAAGGPAAPIAVFRPAVTPGATPPVVRTARPDQGQPPAGQNPLQKQVPVLPQGGLARSQPQPDQHQAPVTPQGGIAKSQPAPQAPVVAPQPPNNAEAARLQALQQRQAAEAARQHRQQTLERFTSPSTPRAEITGRQAAERQELQRIQQNQRAAVQNRAAISQPPQQQRAAVPKPPQPQKKPPPPPQPGQPNDKNQPPPR